MPSTLRSLKRAFGVARLLRPPTGPTSKALPWRRSDGSRSSTFEGSATTDPADVFVRPPPRTAGDGPVGGPRPPGGPSTTRSCSSRSHRRLGCPGRRSEPLRTASSTTRSSPAGSCPVGCGHLLDLAPDTLVRQFETWRHSTANAPAEGLLLIPRRLSRQSNSIAPPTRGAGGDRNGQTLLAHPVGAEARALSTGDDAVVGSAHGQVHATGGGDGPHQPAGPCRSPTGSVAST